MTTSTEVEDLRREVRYLKDRAAITDCIMRAMRGHDRHDTDIISSAYFADGWDEHGQYVTAGRDYANWINGEHEKVARLLTHHITTHTCEITGDEAHCESYVLGGLLSHDEKSVSLISGRYVDRLERRDGEWRIAVRRTLVDWACTADAAVLNDPEMLKRAYPMGTRDKQDLSYRRPLTLQSPTERWNERRRS
jgi:hypothetical protein